MSAALVAATLLWTGCGGSEAKRSAGTGSDPVPSAPSADLRAAMERLLRGPTTPSPTDAAPSWFSAATAHALRAATVDPSGHATIDFQDLRSLIPNASSSAGSASLLEELNAAVFHLPGIRSVEYQMEGSCERFWEWLQYGCHTVVRESTPHRR